jgi:hypothetical protein
MLHNRPGEFRLECPPAWPEPADVLEALDAYGRPPTPGLLRAAGIDRLHMDTLLLDAWGYENPIVAADIVPEGSTFEFAAEATSFAAAEVGLLWSGWNAFGDAAEVFAFVPRTGQLLTWLGRLPFSDERELYAPRLGEPLRVFRSFAEWMSAGRAGVLIVDLTRCARGIRDWGPIDAGRDREWAEMLFSAASYQPAVFVTGC